MCAVLKGGLAPPGRQGPADVSITVGSGKGGAGKSTTSVNLAATLAQSNFKVGLLDADFHGPNIPLMIGLKRDDWTQQWTLAEVRARQRTLLPIDRYGIKFMSAGFILGEDQPMALDAVAVGMMLNQLLFQTEWGRLDYLIIDLPPGTSHITQQVIKSVHLTGALVVVGPQDVSHLDARKAISMFRRLKVPVIGAVENMTDVTCPHCEQSFALFPKVRHERSVWAMNVSSLGAIPFDPRIADCTDRGVPIALDQADSSAAHAFRTITTAIQSRLAEG